jgi:hypothetical protein
MKILLTPDELTYLQGTNPKWIKSIEKSMLTTSENSFVTVSDFVTPTQIYSFGREYQMYLLTPLDNQ